MFKKLILTTALLFLISCSSNNVNVEKQKEYANLLREKGLFTQSINEFKKLMDSGALSDKEQANISYIIGNIYIENLHDYENALTAFLKVKVFSPEGNLAVEVNSKVIECLERTGRSLDAQQEMEKVTTINKKPEIPKGTVVAKIRNRSITKEELDNQIRNLPSYMQDTYKEDAKKLEFLKQYIATELMYDSAKRKNFENNKDIIEKTFQTKKMLMVQKLLEEELKLKVKITESDLKTYYEAHKKDFCEKGKDGKEVQKTYDEAKEQVGQKVSMMKQQEAYEELIGNLLKAEQVTVYEDVFKTK